MALFVHHPNVAVVAWCWTRRLSGWRRTGDPVAGRAVGCPSELALHRQQLPGTRGSADNLMPDPNAFVQNGRAMIPRGAQERGLRVHTPQRPKRPFCHGPAYALPSAGCSVHGTGAAAGMAHTALARCCCHLGFDRAELRSRVMVAAALRLTLHEDGLEGDFGRLSMNLSLPTMGPLQRAARYAPSPRFRRLPPP